jgi:hypothetical protein
MSPVGVSVMSSLPWPNTSTSKLRYEMADVRKPPKICELSRTVPQTSCCVRLGVTGFGRNTSSPTKSSRAGDTPNVARSAWPFHWLKSSCVKLLKLSDLVSLSGNSSPRTGVLAIVYATDSDSRS